MKSAIFESINDRQNIINAYLKMVGESTVEDDIDESVVIRMDDDDLDIHGFVKKFENGEIEWTDDEQEAERFQHEELGQNKIEAICARFHYDPSTFSIKSVDPRADEPYEDDEFHKDMIEVLIPEWAAVYYENADDSGLTPEDKKLADKYMDEVIADGYTLSYDGESVGFCSNPEFGEACDCVKYYLVKNEDNTNESVESGGGWFSEQGELLKEIPEECVRDCTQPGRDAYEDCKYWVKELGFDKGLDIPLAKGYLKWSGGWEPSEIAGFSPEETAIRLLWMVCGDLRDGMDVITIGDGGRFEGDSVGESADGRMVKVILTAIEWPKGGDARKLPPRDAMTVEIRDGDDIEDIVKSTYVDSFGFAPKSFNIARTVELGGKKNEVLSQKELDELKKKNPDLEDISETK